MRHHLARRTGRRFPQARDLRERITIQRQGFDADGQTTGVYTDRAANVPARLVNATSTQVFTEDTLRLENIRSFQIRYREVESTDLILWQGHTMEIQGIVDLVPRVWLQLACRDSE